MQSIFIHKTVWINLDYLQVNYLFLMMEKRKNYAGLNVYFKSTTGLCYVVDTRTTWEDFICIRETIFIYII